MEISSPVSQVYINDDDIETFVCINNFYSVIEPRNKVSCDLILTFINCKGVPVLKINYNLPFNGSKLVSIKNLFLEENISSKLGSVCVKLMPRSIDEFVNNGKVTHHFFTIYKNEKSISTVHTQSAIDAKPFLRQFWRSNQLIDTDKLKKIKIYQCNHLQENVEIEYSLFDAQTDELFMSKSLKIHHLSSQYVEFDLEEKSQGAHKNNLLYLKTNRLPCGNSKPLIMREYNDGIFSISHG